MTNSISNISVFYRKWRPQFFKDVMGQETLIQTLRQAIIQNRIGHAYLLAGPRGTGKTTTARILSKSINCLTNIPGTPSASNQDGEPCGNCQSCESITKGASMDLIEMDAASNRRIDDIRDLQERVFGAGPSISRSKVYIIDEVHMLTDQSFNALLKTLEEPAPWAHFILCTTEPHKVPATIISRCQRFDLSRIPNEIIKTRLEYICNKEEINTEGDPLSKIASASSGSLRDACNMLEQISIANNNIVTDKIVDNALGTNLDPYSLSLIENLAEQNIIGGLEVIANFSSHSYDIKEFRKNILSDLRDILLEKSGGSNLTTTKKDSEERVLSKCAKLMTWDQLIQYIRIFGKSIVSDHGDHGMLIIELAFIECCSISDINIISENASTNTKPRSIEIVKKQEQINSIEEIDPLQTQNEDPNTTLDVHPNEPTVINPAFNDQKKHIEELNSLSEKDWDSICKSLKKFRGKTFVLGSLLYDCVNQFIEDDSITLVFKNKPNLERFKSELDHPPSKLAVEEALLETLSKSYEVKLEIADTFSDPKVPEGHMVRSAIAMGARIINEEENQNEPTIDD